MRITLLTNRDLASNIALNLLLPTLSDKHEVEAPSSPATLGTPSGRNLDVGKRVPRVTLTPNDLVVPADRCPSSRG